jgi:hypothetical protein
MVSEIFLIIVLQMKNHFYRGRMEIIFKTDHVLNKKSKKILFVICTRCWKLELFSSYCFIIIHKMPTAS